MADKKLTYYLGTFDKKNKDFKDFLEKKDFTSLKFFGHKLKGTGKSFGFEKISEIGKRIEENADTKNIDNLLMLFDELSKVFEEIKNDFNSSKNK